MNILELFKPLIKYLAIRLTEARDVTLLSVWFSIPMTFALNILNWATAEANVDYVRIVLTAIAIDHVLGTVVHSRFYKDDFSLLKNMGGLGIKLLAVISMGSIFDGLSTLAISQDFVYKYLFFVTRIIVFLYPARSAMRNCYIVTRGAFPPKILMERSDSAFNNLDINIFIKKTNDTTSTKGKV